MGLAVSTARHIRSMGHDATHLLDQGLHRLSDEQIVEKALEEDRVILTHDLDFGRIVALSRSGFPSVITFRLNDMRPVTVNHVLDDLLSRLGSDIESGALVSVSDQSIRVRPLPIGETDRLSGSRS